MLVISDQLTLLAWEQSATGLISVRTLTLSCQAGDADWGQTCNAGLCRALTVQTSTATSKTKQLGPGELHDYSQSIKDLNQDEFFIKLQQRPTPVTFYSVTDT